MFNRLFALKISHMYVEYNYSMIKVEWLAAGVLLIQEA